MVKTKIILLWNYHEKDTYEKFDMTSRVLGYTKEVNIFEHMLHSIMMSFMHFDFPTFDDILPCFLYGHMFWFRVIFNRACRWTPILWGMSCL